MTTLLISEKPNAAFRIASALAEGSVVKKVKRKAVYYEITRKGERILVVPAVGHLYSLSQKEKGSGYPVFDVEWVPTHSISDSMKFSEGYLSNFIELSKSADSFVSSTDFDVEGEVIAANILEFACKAKNARRMKFSTLTSEELVASFENLLPSIDYRLASAGRARHFLDWFFGINLSRALMSAIKSAGLFKILSVGRVQGPALAILARREKEISEFVPKPFWQVFVDCKGVEFSHVKEKFFDKKEADSVKERTSKKGVVEKVEKRIVSVLPPFPYDLTSMQVDAYRCFGFSPSRSLELAQELYEQGIISYPRTSSQKLPSKLNLPKIIQSLSQNPSYSSLASSLVSGKRFVPHEGPKEDPAHPAIFPTGVSPNNLNVHQAKLYDLIVKRFLACFASPAKKERMKVSAFFGEEAYFVEGSRLVEEGWMKFFSPYVSEEDFPLPEFFEKEVLKADKVRQVEKKTSPPKRYTQATLIKKLESLGLGTKATRAEIIKTLFDRKYVKGKSIEVTSLGFSVFNALEKYCKEILSEELTRRFEKEMEDIQSGKKEMNEVLEEGKSVLIAVLSKFKEREKEIGEALLEGFNKVQREEQMAPIGVCNKCGKNLLVRKSKYGFFVGCQGYPDCRNVFPIPKNSIIEPVGRVCSTCGTPIVLVKRKGKKPFQMCLLPSCETKASWGKYSK